MIQSHKHQVKDVDLMRTNGPRRIPIVLHWPAFVFLNRPVRYLLIRTPNYTYRNKPSNRLGNVLCQFRTCDRPGRVAKIPSGDLTAPGLIAWPLCFVHCQDQYIDTAKLCEARLTLMRTEIEGPRSWNIGSSRATRRANRPCIASFNGTPASSGFCM